MMVYSRYFIHVVTKVGSTQNPLYTVAELPSLLKVIKISLSFTKGAAGSKERINLTETGL